MATTFGQLVRELRAFRARREITKACRLGLRRAATPARKAIRAAAVETLPHAGGLNLWVSKISITVSARFSGRGAGITLKGGRNSLGARSDVKAIDAGATRAPSWGKRTAASWHTVTVKPGFFTQTAADLPDWRDDVDAEVDRALDRLRTGRG